jgi:hypothetical protein
MAQTAKAQVEWPVRPRPLRAQPEVPTPTKPAEAEAAPVATAEAAVPAVRPLITMALVVAVVQALRVVAPTWVLIAVRDTSSSPSRDKGLPMLAARDD